MLLYLHGVIPITYSGATYNIPVTIYFDPPYPSQPPRCFVTPTAGMALKTGHPHVDTGGMIYLPYLNAWSSHRSTLPDLLTIIASTFSSQPPVYSPAGAPAAKPQSQASGAGQQQPRPPVPRPVATVSAYPVPGHVAGPVQAIPVATATPVPKAALSEKERLARDFERQVRARWLQLLEPTQKD